METPRARELEQQWKIRTDMLRAEYRANIQRLYAVMGLAQKNCDACGRAIWFVRTERGRFAPFTDDGVSHFADCPKADELRRLRAQ